MLPLPSVHQLPGVFDRSDTQPNADGILYPKSRRLSSYDLNENTQFLLRRMDAGFGAIFADGDIAEGGKPASIQGANGENVQINAGKVFLRGKIYNFDAVQLTVPTDQTAAIGVRLYTTYDKPEDDASILSPVSQTRGFGEPGGVRVCTTIAWGWKAEDGTNDGGTGDFFPVYTMDNGVVVVEDTSPESKLVYGALQRYDDDAHGSYISAGLLVKYISEDGDNYYVQVDAGSAHVRGVLFDRTSDTRLTLPKDPDINTALSEVHTFQPDISGRMNVLVNRPPIGTITRIVGQKQKTNNVVRGQTTNGRDVIDQQQSSIVSVSLVKQGGTTYVLNTDYTLSGDEINWSPGGAEPTAGSTYAVTFIYEDSAGVAESVQPNFFVLSGYVTGSTVLVDYTYKLRRIDLIVLNGDGTIARVRGVPSLTAPSAPVSGPNQIALATVEIDWFNAPTLRNTGTKAVHMSTLQDMQAQILELYSLIGQQTLINAANTRNPSQKKGLFVDPFTDDSYRDTGTAQTAAIVNGLLMLAIDGDGFVPDGDAATAFQMLPYNTVVAVEQKQASLCQLINPYQNANAPDSIVNLKPASDSWVLFSSQYKSQLTKLLVQTGLVNQISAVDARKLRRMQQINNDEGGPEIPTDEDVNASITSTTTTGIACRQRTIAFTIKGWNPDEQIAEAFFDGVPLTAVLGQVADLNGQITGTFVIPAGLPTGLKLVTFAGDQASECEVVYTAKYSVIPNPVPKRKKKKKHDPLAQTFLIPNDMQCPGIDIKFCKRGPTLSPVQVQIRETQVGFPTENIIAETEISVDDMNIVGAVQATQNMTGWCRMASNGAGTNFHTGTTALVYSDATGIIDRSLFKFNLPNDLAGATIVSAVLKMRKVSGAVAHTTFPVKARRVTTLCDVTTASWNSKSVGQAWGAPGGDFSIETQDGNAQVPAGTNRWVTWDVTNIAAHWAGGSPNYGILLQSAVESTPASGTNRADLAVVAPSIPSLEITYVPAQSGFLGEGWTRCLFPIPAFLRGGQNYAITILTDDPGHSVSIARLNDVLPAMMNNGVTGFISRQPYADGVLLDSADAVSWNARGKDDLTFRLLACAFTQTELIVDLGNVPGTNITDIFPKGSILRYSGDTDITWDVTIPAGGGTVNLANADTLPLTTPVTGNFNFKARIEGTATLSPIVLDSPVMVLGTIENSGTYVSQFFKAADTFNATVLIDALLPSGSNIQVAIASQRFAGGNPVLVDGVYQFDWLTLTLDHTDPADNGYVTQTWKLNAVRGFRPDFVTQVKITLNGGASARLLGKNLQAFSI